MEFKVILDHPVTRQRIAICQKENHKQQVAFSTYHDCLTQICFTCQTIRTELSEI